MYIVEKDIQPDKFGSIPQSMWWSIVTLTTVGYGDVYPVTSMGKFFGSIIIILGIIPSFLWAYFNASPGYIETGWPGLILGGVILGILSGLFWRPKQPTWWADGSKMFPRR